MLISQLIELLNKALIGNVNTPSKPVINIQIRRIKITDSSATFPWPKRKKVENFNRISL